jgi:GT2 family glycosyltransferase
MGLDHLKIYVIIVTYKGRQWYDRCFTSLRESTIPVQTIVVDNASNDGTLEYIRENYPEIHLIESKENLGFGRANNIGMRYALDQGCDFVFLLNQDAWVEADAFDVMLRVALSHPEYGILAPVHTTPDKTKLERGFVSFAKDNKYTDGTWFDDMYWGRMKEVYDTKYIHAAGWLLPRRVLESVGGFDPIFIHYEEDDDYLNRVRYHGYKIGICPRARMVHDCNREYVYAKGKELLRHQQILLVDFVDVNQEKSVREYCTYLLRKTLASMMRMQRRQMQLYWKDYLFFHQMQGRIQESREKNRQKGSNWL